MDHEEVLIMIEALKEVNAVVKQLAENPLLVTETDIDMMDYNIMILNDYSKRFKK